MNKCVSIINLLKAQYHNQALLKKSTKNESHRKTTRVNSPSVGYYFVQFKFCFLQFAIDLETNVVYNQVTVVLLDVNDLAPEFISPNQTSIMENAPLNSVVMAIKAVDKDEGRNGYVEYSLDSKDLPFTLGTVDGLLRVSGSLDREFRPNYTLRVTARDKGEHSKFSSTVITVVVLDENDNSPVFEPTQYSTTVAENASIGASILQVSKQRACARLLMICGARADPFWICRATATSPLLADFNGCLFV